MLSHKMRIELRVAHASNEADENDATQEMFHEVRAVATVCPKKGKQVSLVNAFQRT